MLLELKKAAIEAITSILPLVIVILILQFTVLHAPPELLWNFLIGAAMAIVGVTLFLAGVRIGILPMGRDVGAELPQHESLLLIIVSAVIFGFVVTVTEPGVMVLSELFVQLGGDGGTVMVIVVAVGMAILFMAALVRIIFGFPIRYLLMAVYGIAVILALFAPPEYVALAFDSGSAAAGSFTVPMMLALGLGFVSVLARRSSLSDGFGLVGLACAGPIIGILCWGVFF
ncbi:MAG: DUF1538 domain-containing protein [Dehalococcoidales bacterium]|jgi:hypothetical protein|nr:DUF1538 domain-containing protein [Dehalococcoidales bacterium]MDD3994780.1 DUF1538 domain-containing protein [Dehalococcoidales bacterium]NLT28515.1 DUF1538 domain-containing protein [Dehalococcoidales bacterium]